MRHRRGEVPQAGWDESRACALTELDKKVATKEIDRLEWLRCPAQMDVPRGVTCEAKLTLVFCTVKARGTLTPCVRIITFPPL